MLPSVCFQAGRFTPTQSSWTVQNHCSRKWMSGQADALTVAKDRGRFARNTCSTTTLRESLSAGRTPSLLDFYLSWMSPNFFHLFAKYANERSTRLRTVAPQEQKCGMIRPLAALKS